MSLRGFRSLLAIIDVGFQPVGAVMGAATFQIYRPTGCRGYGPWTGTQPLIFASYEQAMRNAWRNALDRLEAEAVRVDAHGVVGVSVTQQVPTTTRAVTHVQLVGSAVRVRGAEPLQRPFLSMLAMDDTLKLLLRGWVPSGIAVGISAVHVHGWGVSPYGLGVGQNNVELAVPTAGMAFARARAEYELRQALVAGRAEGTVAAEVNVKRTSHSCGYGQPAVMIEGRIMGTGVVRYRGPVVELAGVRDLSASGSS